MVIFKLALISVLGVSATALSCYSLDPYSNVVEVKHNQKFCYSLFSPSDNSASHGGQTVHPAKASELWHIESPNDCFEKIIKAVDAERSLYICKCYENMCNYPFTFREFAARNYTIKPDYYNLVNGAI
ncbi:hypothetical protein B9Z55_026556 [Caenorhabditis nigoni]|uniref:Uncharacterized protein n=1 Tax=Caenorhabditis nigoni TaxID=1611254 RepID=A0A2G5T3A2_9PELO|nr:hypothetical protein B9Z55_026556 [Caenorhabditis nigoni]